jgi:hypothetical protein
MNKNYQIIYTTDNGYVWWYNHIVRLLIPDKNYFYNLFVNLVVKFYRYVPLRPYMNNTGFKL